MTTEELIMALQKSLKEHGNLDVRIGRCTHFSGNHVSTETNPVNLCYYKDGHEPCVIITNLKVTLDDLLK